MLGDGRGVHPEVTGDGAECGVGMEELVYLEDGDCGRSGLTHDGDSLVIETNNEKGTPPCTDDWLFLSHCHSLPPLFLGCSWEQTMLLVYPLMNERTVPFSGHSKMM